MCDFNLRGVFLSTDGVSDDATVGLNHRGGQEEGDCDQGLKHDDGY